MVTTPGAGRLVTCPVIAIVSSAGGLAATGTVLAELPPGLAAAVLVLQHLSPDHESRLPEVLGTYTKLPVAAARDGQALAPGRVAVAVAAHHLLVTGDRRLALVPSGPIPPCRPSADLLLATLAAVAGPDTIAVVLSGTGTDGSTGAAAVHRLGGTVITTDAATSIYFGMPQACIVRGETVDHVVALGRVASLLRELVLQRVP
ncbi:two-component system, chemotaxis family, response regulator CheB [Nonomuraea solani]|uniref:protein-glutamate methylesterase n=1 Tax=Nonomuraea solani TaxID=1144553 RepID=A0A1H6EXC5_9ACTN|nr:chemotaxis protein CheB [Nonomuraea solani]SEH01274.1 two-component system, chemotaxis family, response regulator CheB [Nonomuraea solani]